MNPPILENFECQGTEGISFDLFINNAWMMDGPMHMNRELKAYLN